MPPTNTLDEIQKLDGPDYITVVVEWTDEEAPTMVSARALPRAQTGRMLATVLSALGAIALTTWGLRLLKPA